MFATIFRATVAVLTRVVAVIFGLLLSFYLQLGGDIRAPVGVQIDEALARLRELARALDSFG
ncbi:MAG: hypothetical protein H6872_08605 [Methylobacteriaceae bacterium]|nr:hypothetical protein [Rhodoblastus sp.]MCC0005200.1 hypothetical protein [Methylobacteriaceae bacterium]